MSKEAMKLALEALENSRSLEPVDVQWVKGKRHAAITTLREALAEQPATTETNGGKTGWPPGLLQDDCKGLSKWLSSKPDAKRRVREALDKMAENARELGLDYEPAQTDWEAVAADQAMTIALLKAERPAQQEPVAWILKCGEQQELWWEKPPFGETVPLYTSPQPAQPSKPLTKDQIAKFYGGDSPIVFQIIRDTEAAHGIKENT